MTQKSSLTGGYRKCKEELPKQVEDIDRELFWTKLDQYWSFGDLEKFRAFWQANPKYIQEFNENYERQMADPNSALRKKQDAWREKQKAKRIAELERDV